MRVLIFCSANLDTGSGSAIRARLIIEGLRECGADLWIISSGVPDGFVAQGISSSILKNDTSWEKMVASAIDVFSPDVVIGVTEAGTDSVMKAVKKKHPVIYDLHGIGFVEVLELGKGYGSRRKRIQNSLRWLSYILKADALTVANPTLVPIIKPFNSKTLPVIGITDVSRFSPEGPQVQLGKDKSRIQVLYAGNWFKWQGIELLLKAIMSLVETDDSFEFTFLGSTGKDVILAQENIDIENDYVNLLNSVNYDRVAEYYRGADVLVIPRPFMLSTYLAFPQKLVDYMAAKKAIVATNLAPHRWALEKPAAGILCPPTVNGLIEGILKTKDSNLRRSLAVNARKKAEEDFCHLKQSEKIYTLLNDIVQVK